MYSGNYKLAWKRVRTSKLHSVLTMFGIIVGIISVITTVSLGEGIKRQVVNQVSKVGGNVITVRPGDFVERDKNGAITYVDPTRAYGFGSGSLSERDIDVVRSVKGVSAIAPLNLLNANLVAGEVTYRQGYVLGSDAALPDVLQHQVLYGSYFDEGESTRNVAVIGKRVAENLFQENIPIGQSLTVRGEEFIVRGVFDEFGSGTLGQGIDLNKAVVVPREALRSAVGDAAPLVQIVARTDKKQTALTMRSVETALQKAHGDQRDTTVLRQDENILVAGEMLDVLTKFIVAIGAIALLVGGIGVMNIMLASVSERTAEIGIRKAVGATNRQIRNQFMAEAVVLSLVGGLVGVVGSFLTSFIIRVTTNFYPVITWPVVLLAVGVSMVVGVIFGTVPAIKAARKDPIQALRGM